MPEAIEQINFSYSKKEDRLLLRVRMSKGERGCWITRYFSNLLLDVFRGYHPQTHRPLFAASQETNLHQQMAQTAAALSGDYEQEYQAVKDPEDEAFFLLTTLNLKVSEKNQLSLTLQPEHGEGFVLNLDAALLGQLNRILEQVLLQTHWNLDMGLRLPGEDSLSATWVGRVQ